MKCLKVCLKYQRYENFHSCFQGEKSEFPDVSENWWSKRKNKGKKETNEKKRKRKQILKGHVFHI